MKTIKQVADDLGISKQRLYRYIKKHCISDVHYDMGVIHITDALESDLKTIFAKNDAHHDMEMMRTTNAVNSAQNDDSQYMLIIETLREQLATKDCLIEQQGIQIADLTAALRSAQAQAENLTTALTAAQTLHAADKRALLLFEDKESSRKMSFFERLIAKKSQKKQETK